MIIFACSAAAAVAQAGTAKLGGTSQVVVYTIFRRTLTPDLSLISIVWTQTVDLPSTIQDLTKDFVVELQICLLTTLYT